MHLIVVETIYCPKWIKEIEQMLGRLKKKVLIRKVTKNQKLFQNQTVRGRMKVQKNDYCKFEQQKQNRNNFFS
jgi:hypothetical protein